MAGKAGMFRLPRFFSRSYFRDKARPLLLRVGASSGDFSLGDAKPRENATGSLGWHLARKVYVKVGDAQVMCQVNVNITVMCSAALPREDTGPAAA